MATKVCKKSDIKLNKRFLSDLRIEIEDVGDRYCKIKVYAENKAGRFELYPGVLREHALCKGMSLFIGSDDNFRFKMRLKYQ